MKKAKEVAELVKPTKNRVFIQVIEESAILASGIVKPDSQIESEPYCNILAVGPQVTDMKPGDLGLMRLNLNADVFKIEGKKYAMITDFDITGVIDPNMRDMFKRKNVQDVKPTPLAE